MTTTQNTTDSNEQQGAALEPCWCRTSTTALSVQAHMSHGDFGCRERGRYVYCSNCWACGPTYNTDAEAIKGWNRSRPVSAAPADRKLYSELIHIAAECVRGSGFLSPCAEDIAPRLKRADILKTARRQESQLKDWAYRIRQVANRLSAATTSSPAAQPTENVKRFSNTYEDGIWCMDERADGKWVRYSEHERIVRNLEAHVAERDALLSPSPTAASEGEQGK